jgi:hypothetical protein
MLVRVQVNGDYHRQSDKKHPAAPRFRGLGNAIMNSMGTARVTNGA